jgi:hypothetical protein
MLEIGLGVLLLGIGLPVAQAQQTVFNVPSADITPKGSLFLQHESQFRPWQPGRSWLGTHYAAVGIGHHTELDATLINVSTPPSDNIALMLGVKSAQPLLKKPFPNREIKLTAGTMIPVSFQGHGVGYWTYGHVSMRLPRLNTRLAVGVSGGTMHLFGRDTVHLIASYEHPLSKRISLIGDWFSGTHASGLFIPGVSIALTGATNAYLGFQIPNNPQSGRSGLVFELARFF